MAIRNCIARRGHFELAIVDGTPVTPQEYIFPMAGLFTITPGFVEEHRYLDGAGRDATGTYGVGKGNDNPTTVEISDCQQVDFGQVVGAPFADLLLIDFLFKSGAYDQLVTTSGDESVPCENLKTVHLELRWGDPGVGGTKEAWRIEHSTRRGQLASGNDSNKIGLSFTSGSPYPVKIEAA